MAYLSVAETAEKWGVSERSVRNYCAHGRVDGAILDGKTWFIPQDAQKPGRISKRNPTQSGEGLDIQKNMRIYTIIGGVNGAGKSSFTGVLKESRRDLGRIIDVDKITAQLGRDAIKGGKEAIRRIDDCLQKGISFTQETTLSGIRTERTAKKAMEAGYYVRLYYVGLDTVQESLDRIANRVKRGGHDIPKDDVLRRFDSRWVAVAKVLPYCNEAEFYDNDNGFVKVGEYRNGELILMGETHPQWIRELKSYLEEN